MKRVYVTQKDKDYQKLIGYYRFYVNAAFKKGKRIDYIPQFGWDYTLELNSVTIVAGWTGTIGTIVVLVENRALKKSYTYRYCPGRPGRPLTFIEQDMEQNDG